jgi:hypothetical protein
MHAWTRSDNNTVLVYFFFAILPKLPTLTTRIPLSLTKCTKNCTNTHHAYVIHAQSLLRCITLVGGVIHVGFHDALGFEDPYETILAGVPHYQFTTECALLHALLDSILRIGVPL